jgi:hypothetical protein
LGIIKKFTAWIGIVFIVFAALSAIISYELIGVMYTTAPPLSYFVYTIMTTMLPFLLGAVIAFIAAYICSQQEKQYAENDTETPKKEIEAAETP